jgi:hypothetical protein
MSKTTDWVINTADDRADDDARELARLRDIVARAHAILDEGDPAGVLDKMAEFASKVKMLNDGTLRAVARAIREARAILGG